MIVSDKVFVVATESDLRERFGNANLLVVGSPSSNLLARRLNEHAVFRFSVEETVWTTLQGIEDECKHRERNDLLQIAALKKKLLKALLLGSRNGGFVDPTAEVYRRAMFIPVDEDYGVISICRHPFLSDSDVGRHAVLVAGVHLPATMYGVKLLSDHSHFERRPFGGVFKIHLDPNKRWDRRLMNLSPEWSTPPYEPPELIHNFKEMAGSDLVAMGRKPQDLKKEIHEIVRFIEQISLSPTQPEKGSRGTCQEL